MELNKTQTKKLTPDRIITILGGLLIFTVLAATLTIFKVREGWKNDIQVLEEAGYLPSPRLMELSTNIDGQ